MVKLQDSTIDKLVPEWQSDLPEVQAIGYALSQSNQRILNLINQSMVYAGIDNLQEKVLDVLAVELRAQFYDEKMELSKKREIIKNTLYLHGKAGTVSAVEEMVEYVFGGGKVTEWFDYEGEPFHFKVSTTEILSGEKNETFTKLIKSMKNARSHLDLITTERTTESTIYLAAGETSHTIAPVIIAN